MVSENFHKLGLVDQVDVVVAPKVIQQFEEILETKDIHQMVDLLVLIMV